jgi:hypothetical protein
MFCAGCGTRLRPGAGFCSGCGAAVVDDADAVARVGRAVQDASAAAVKRRLREAAAGLGDDMSATLEAVATMPEAQQLGERVREIDTATGGTIGRAGKILGQLLQGRRPR